MLIVVFSIKLGWLPTSGMENIAAFYEGWERVRRRRAFTWCCRR